MLAGALPSLPRGRIRIVGYLLPCHFPLLMDGKADLWVILVVAYFAAACAFTFFIELRDPLATFNSMTASVAIGRALGLALGLFGTAAIIPAIIWSIGRFRPKDARPNYNRAALTLLPVFGVIFAYALERGDRFGREEKITAELGHSAFSPAEQAEFISSVKSGCIKTQQQADLNRQLGVTDRQIVAHCDCYATYVSRVVEMEELRYYARNGKMPETFARKLPAAYQACSKQLSQRMTTPWPAS